MKNVILLTIDCLRRDVVNKQLMPFFSEISKRGVVFDNCFSVASWTAPSFQGILTSTYPLMYGGKLKIDELRVSLAQVVKDQGYTTAGFTFHPFLHRFFGYNVGFDYYYDDLQGGELQENRLIKFISELLFRLIKSKGLLKKISYLYYVYSLQQKLKSNYRFYLPAEEVNKRAVKTLVENNNKPFFHWLHYMDVHFPYLPQKPKFSKQRVNELNVLREKWFRGDELVNKNDLEALKELYNQKVGDVDRAIKNLFDILRKKQLLGKTTVIITSDHGEEFMEHGGFHHELKLYDELIHVPLLIFDPDLSPKVITRMVSLIDLAPTITDLLGLPKSENWLGKNLLKINQEYVFAEEGQKIRGWAHRHNFTLDLSCKTVAIRSRKFKYIYHQNGSDELYDLENDRQESNNIIAQGVPSDFKNVLQKHLRMIS